MNTDALAGQLQQLLERMYMLERAVASFNDECSKEEAENIQREIAALRRIFLSLQPLQSTDEGGSRPGAVNEF